MRKQLITTAIALLAWGSAMAVPAKPGTIKVQQPDGTVLTVVLRGDEFFHTVFTEDGHPLVLNEQTQCYEYATVSGSQLLPSGIRATEVAQRTADATAFLANFRETDLQSYYAAGKQLVREKRAMLAQSARTAAKAAPQKAAGQTRLRISDVPTTGSPKALAVLVEFTDHTFSSYVGNAATFYHDMLNTPNYTSAYGCSGSAYDFFKKSSNGAYTPVFDVYGPVTLDHAESYYAGSGGTANTYRLVKDVVEKLDDTVDFSQYDTDGDGKVDNIYFFYAGYGQADSGDSRTIWPHNYEASLAGLTVMADGVQVDRYACSEELNYDTKEPNGIGTFVHEFGHVLGIPDLYDGYYTYTHYTMGYYSTMCIGSYLNDQNTPLLYNAYERYALGWLEPMQLNRTDTSEKTLGFLDDTNQSYLVTVPGQSSEYYLLENIQKTGWSQYAPGHGLLAIHVDESPRDWDYNTVNDYNNSAGHDCVFVVPADGTRTYGTEASDPFPGTNGVTTKDFTCWTGQTLFGFASVTESDEGVITFTLNDKAYTLDAPTNLTVTDVKGQSATATWTASKGASEYNVTLLQDGTAVQTSSTSKTSITFSGLTPQTDYTVEVTAASNGWYSDAVSAPFTTTEVTIGEQQVTALEATDVTSTSFTANWEALDGMDSYLLTVYDSQYQGEDTTITYGFANRDASLPQGWSYQGGRYGTGKLAKGTGLFLSEKFGATEPSLTVSRKEAMVKSLSFWCCASKANTKVTITGYKDGAVTNTYNETLKTTGSNLKYSFASGADSVRIVYIGSHATDSEGNLLASEDTLGIDNVSITVAIKTAHAMENLTDINVGTATSYQVSGLEPGGQYYYSVVGVQNGEQTMDSKLISVRLGSSTAITDVPASLSSHREVFDLQGRRILNGQLPRGLYIIRENGASKKVMVK